MAVKTPATEQQISFLSTLWNERLDEEFPAARIRGMGFAHCSALIAKLKGVQPLPATDEQIAKIAAMDREQGFDREVEIRDRAHANIVLRNAEKFQERQSARASVNDTLKALGVDPDSLLQRVDVDEEVPWA